MDTLTAVKVRIHMPNVGSNSPLCGKDAGTEGRLQSRGYRLKTRKLISAFSLRKDLL